MNNIKIILTRVGYSNSILIVNGANSILVDTGVRGNLHRFKVLLEEHNLMPEDIKLVVLTHTHYDHTGNLKELVKLCGAKVIVHKNEFENLKSGFTPIPKGVSFKTHFIAELGRFVYPKYASPKSFVADIINQDELDLNDFGLDGKIISTPGHTNGSQSVLIGNRLISGDTFLNLKNGIIFPHFANNPKQLLETWQNIYDLGVQEIYPGHGKKMKVEKTFETFQMWKNKLK